MDFVELARSCRCDHGGRSADVWRTAEGWRWTVLDRTSREYLDCGHGLASQAAAIEAAKCALISD